MSAKRGLFCGAVIAALFGAGCTSNPSSGGGGSSSQATGSGGQGGQGGQGGGSSGTGGQGGADSGCAMTPTFTEVLQKPLSGCSGFEPPCHNADAGELTIDPMNPKSTWKQLVGVKTFSKGSGIRVVPGDPAHSFLYRKLTDDLGPNEGSPMPKPPSLGSGMWTELPMDEIETVRCWIAGGAKDD